MEQTSSSRSWFRVESVEAARLVTDPASLRFLEPFVGQERSVGEVAFEIGASMSSVLYRVRQFVRLGLVTESALQPRRGRPIRRYRSVAEGFFVPFRVTAATTEESLAALAFRRWRELLDVSVGRAWVEAFGDENPIGIQLFRRPDGSVTRNIAPDPDGGRWSRSLDLLLEPASPAVWDAWNTVRLSRRNAKALQREIADLAQRYRALEQEGGRDHLVRLAIAPID